MNNIALRVALVLGLAAAPAAVIAPPVPAHACGGEYASPAMLVRQAAFVYVREKLPETTDVSVRVVKIEGKKASVEVRYSEGSRAMTRPLWLAEDAEGQWKVARVGKASNV